MCSLVHNALIAGAVLGVLGGVVGVLVITRDLPFAVHGISELSFAGAAAALLLGVSVVVGSLAGSVLAALIIGLVGNRARDRNSVIGVMMPFGLGLGILFLSLYTGRAANKFGLLTGQIVAVDTTNLRALIIVAVIVLLGLAVIWRPLMFASVDTDVAAARGVPIRVLGAVFMVLLGCVVALSVQVVGALLVLALLCTPAAAALRVTASPVLVVVLSVVFATTATVGGIFVALGTDIPISPYVTTISFLDLPGLPARWLGPGATGRVAAARDRRTDRGTRARRGHRARAGREVGLHPESVPRSGANVTSIGVGARSTKQRAALDHVLDELDGFHTAQQLHAILVERGDKVGIATVYRSLQLLVDAGLVDVIHGDEGEASYRRCSTRHHHHLVCRVCGRAVEAQAPAVEIWVDAMAAEHGFTDVSHDLEIFGTCSHCSPSR